MCEDAERRPRLKPVTRTERKEKRKSKRDPSLRPPEAGRFGMTEKMKTATLAQGTACLRQAG
jgi:hypothetical protein